MNYQETINYVKAFKGAASLVKEKSQELFVMTFEEDPELFSDVIIWYSGAKTGEASYNPEEFYMEYEDEINTLNFIPCSHDVTELLGYDFETVMEDFAQYQLKSF